MNLNTQKLTALSALKAFILPADEKLRKIPFGLFKGLTLQIDFSRHTQVYLGLWERETYSCIKALSMDIRSAIDIGAGAGEHSLYFLKKTPARKVYGIEPAPANQARIYSILNANDPRLTSRYTLINKYVASNADIDSMALDDLIPDLLMPCMVKMDIDGGEVSALRGASKLLRCPDMRWLIETHSFELEKECINLFQEAGYSVKIIHNAWWRVFIPELRPGEMNRWLVAYRKSNVRC